MIDASKEFASILANINFISPKCKVFHNYDTNHYTNADDLRNSLVKQLHMPVRWTDTIHKIVKFGVLNIIECGNGKVLSGLNKRIDASIISYTLNNRDDFTNALDSVL